MKGVLVAIGIALVLAFGFGRDEDQPPAPVAAPAPLAVPLAVSETTPPPGWTPPAALTIEQQLGEFLAELGVAARGQIVGAVALLAVLTALVVSLERSRMSGQ